VLIAVRELAVVSGRLELGELALDPRPLRRQQLPCACLVQRFS
jgi:hypothetical protein